MLNKLVWGIYFDDVKNIYIKNNNDVTKKFYTLVNFHRLSIVRAIKLGYECVLYCPPNLFQYFNDLNVTLKEVPNLGIILFDYVKNYILKNEKGNYLIIDGDLILNSRLPNIKSDLLYEKNEINSWNFFYKTQVETLNKLGIRDIIKEWTGNKRNQIINIGLFQINNKDFKELCTDRWDLVKKFIEINIGETTTQYTVAAGQYLITELVDYYQIETKEFKSSCIPNTYIHYMGSSKFEKTFIPHNKILSFKESII